MSTHPYIPLYVDDYDAHTGHLTAEEDGVYSRLLRLAWRTPGCSLPDDHGWIARKIRLSPEDYERVGRPVLSEFFKLVRGRFVQRRLKDEYNIISRKKSARKEAGKKGGDAKARKNKENISSNATNLLAHTRAFPEPEPYPVEEPPNPPGGCANDDLFLAAWLAYPEAGRATIGQDQARTAWLIAMLSVDPVSLLAAVKAYAASEYAKSGGRPKRFDRWLTGGAYAAFLPPPSAAAWPGPPEVRGAIVAATDEAFAAGWLDRCRWRDLPERAVLSDNGFVVDRLRREVGETLDALGISILQEAAA